MWSLLRKVYWLVVVVLISGCSGGGCSGCAGGALQPIPGGYPLTPDTRIPRAAQIRLTESGLRRVQDVAPGLLGGFVGSGIPVPRTVTPVAIAGFNAARAIICPADNCRINVALPNPALQLGFAAPSAITARARILVDGRLPLTACSGNCNDRCQRDGGFLPCVTIANPVLVLNTRRGNHPHIGLSTNATIRRDTHMARLNYHRADIVSPTGSGDVIQETPGEGIENADIECTDSWVCGLINLLRGPIINQFRGQLSAALGPIQEALAASSMPNPPGCPTGTMARGATCVYSDNQQVPTLLGTDGTGNMGALLASVSPGLQAPVSYVLAAGDPMRDGQVVNGGMTINMFGALRSTRHNTCVPRVAAPPIPTVPEWEALRGNTVPGTSTPIDFGLGLSQDFLNHAAFNLWDAGILCLGVGTSLSQTLSAGTLAALPQINSLRAVLFPQTTGPVAIALRPQQPPAVTIGRGSNVMTDPLLDVRLPRLALDFYAWTEERYVRFMTVTADVRVGVNLQVDRGGLAPQLGMPVIENVQATNTQLLSNNPAGIGTALQTILAPALGMLTGALPSIDLPSIPVPGPNNMPLGEISIEVPPSGVQGVTEGQSRFLGIFAALRYTPAGMRPSTLELDTQAALDGVDVDPALYRDADALRLDNMPRVRFTASVTNTFGRDVEYSYRVDQQTWSTFAPGPSFAVQHPALFREGRHVLQVRARVVGEANTADSEPAQIAFTVDAVAPSLRAWREGGEVVAEGHDEGSPDEALEYTFQADEGPATAWGRTRRFTVPAGAHAVTVRVRDTNGNIADRFVGIDQLIRGGATTDAGGSGCGCRVGAPAQRAQGGPWAALAAALGGVFLARRRRRAPAGVARVAAAALAALGATAGGCASDQTGVVTDAGPMPVTCENGQMRCPSTNLCVAPPSCPTCMPGFAPSGTPTFTESTCMYDTSACMCMRLPPLDPGAVGSHLRAAAAADGTMWLSAYSPGSLNDGTRFGDLVVGRVATETGMVTWQHADGVPASGDITGDPDGWRGGNSSPGDDVGRFNSLALTASGEPRVAYWDTTRDRLRYAALAGGQWQAHVVDDGGPNGRYASLALLPNGTPLIAYRASTTGPMGVQTVVRLARANSPTPARAADWTITDVATLPSQCRASDCATGQVCRQSDGRCVATGTGCMNCGTGEACVEGRCAEVYPSNWVEGLGPGAAFINLLVDSMGRLTVVWYHRDRGNLMMARGDAMGRFAAPVILDGERMGRDTGDRGIYASAALGTGDTVHVAYVDGWEERLLHLTVRGAMAMGEPEVIDDGTGVGMMSFDDGRHIIGDSASITVAPDGAVRVAYQDATQGTLRLASRTGTMWTQRVLDSNDHTGYWASIAGNRVATWWRNLSDAGMRRWGVRVLPLP